MVVATCCYFHPDPWGNEPILRSCVSNGLKLNHQLDCCWKSISGNNSTKKNASLWAVVKVRCFTLYVKRQSLCPDEVAPWRCDDERCRSKQRTWAMKMYEKGFPTEKKTWILTDLTVFVVKNWSPTYFSQEKNHLNLAAICLAGRLRCKAAKMEHLATKQGRL